MEPVLTLRIDDFRWIDVIVDKIMAKHQVDPEAAESALLNQHPRPFVWRLGDRYLALAQEEDAGEYLFVVFAMEPGRVARVITARAMNDAEKTRFRNLRNA